MIAQRVKAWIVWRTDNGRYHACNMDLRVPELDWRPMVAGIINLLKTQHGLNDNSIVFVPADTRSQAITKFKRTAPKAIRP